MLISTQLEQYYTHQRTKYKFFLPLTLISSSLNNQNLLLLLAVIVVLVLLLGFVGRGGGFAPFCVGLAVCRVIGEVVPY